MAQEPARTELGRLREEHFAAAYVAAGCKDAAKAGESIGLSPSYAKKLLQSATVKALIADHRAAAIGNLEAARQKLVYENECVASSDIFEVLVSASPRVLLKHVQSLPAHVRKTIKTVTLKSSSVTKPDGTKTRSAEIKVEVHDKNAAHNLRGKFLSMMDKEKAGAAALGEFVKQAMLSPDDPLE